MSLVKRASEFIDEVFGSDHQKSEEIQDQLKLQREQELADLRVVLSTESGVRLFKRLFNQCGLYNQPYKVGFQDRDTYFACGELNTALWLLKECDEALDAETMGRLLFRKVINEVDGSE